MLCASFAKAFKYESSPFAVNRPHRFIRTLAEGEIFVTYQHYTAEAAFLGVRCCLVFSDAVFQRAIEWSIHPRH